MLNKRVGLFLCFFSLLSAMSSFEGATGAELRCSFKYTNQVKRLVDPVLKRFLSDRYKYFDLNSPRISRLASNGDIVVLGFSPSKEMKTSLFFDTSPLEVYYDACQKKAWIPIGAVE